MNPPETVQLEAIRQNPMAIFEIIDYTDAVKEEAIKLNPLLETIF